MDLSLEVDSVLFSFGQRTILSDVYLKCSRGDILAIFGRNGTGKTTLFNIIFGTLKAERSFVRIDGKVVTKNAMRTGLLTYVPQFPIFPQGLSVAKIVKLAIGEEESFSDSLFYKRTKNMAVGNLSGGEQRYLAISLALCGAAPYVILDEPFKTLAPILINKIRDKIKEASANKGIIITDHNYREVHKIANRFMLLRDNYLFPIENKEDLTKYGYYPKQENRES